MATVRGIVPKTDAGYGKIQRAILQMRRDGEIPWRWITDSHRWMRKPTTWDSIDEVLESAAQAYRRALWTDSPYSVEVWVESESVAGVVFPITAKWDVPLYPLKGQTSDSFAWAAAQEYRLDDRQIVILYVGDHDPAGLEIETNLRAKLEEHAERDDFHWRRIACTAEQARELPGTPPKKHTWRAAVTGELRPWRGDAVEVEAVPPTELRAMIESAIVAYVDQNRLAALRMAEESEREILRRMAARP